jgi:hypothetical protein
VSTLYEAVGDAESFRGLAAAWHERVMADDVCQIEDGDSHHDQSDHHNDGDRRRAFRRTSMTREYVHPLPDLFEIKRMTAITTATAITATIRPKM